MKFLWPTDCNVPPVLRHVAEQTLKRATDREIDGKLFRVGLQPNHSYVVVEGRMVTTGIVSRDGQTCAINIHPT